MALTTSQQGALFQALINQAGGIDKLAQFLFALLLQPRAAQLSAINAAVTAFRAKPVASLAAVDTNAAASKTALNSQVADLDAIAANI